MVAMRRGRGSDVVVALVFFVVLTFIAGGLAIWLAQQASAAKEALRENQGAFEVRVATYFEEHSWRVPEEADTGPYNIRFGPDVYNAVRTHLEKAVLYENLSVVAGWESPDAVEQVLEISPLQKESGAAYETVSALLTGYEQKFVSQKDAIQELSRQIGSLNKDVEDRVTAFGQMQKELMGKISELNRQHTTELAARSEKYKEVVEAHEEQRGQTRQWQQKYDDSIAKAEDLKRKMADLGRQVQQLRDTLLAGRRKPEKLVAEGKVIDIERTHNIVIVEGGEDVQREKDERLVVYSESPNGLQTKKAEIVVTDVHPHTSSASVIREAQRIIDGDLFVNADTWHRFHGGQGRSSADEGF